MRRFRTDTFDPWRSLERALGGQREAHTAAWRYSLALAISLAAVAAMWLFQSWLAQTVFLAAGCALVVSVRCVPSFKAGVLVTIITLAATDYLLLDPIGSFRLAHSSDVLRMCVAFTTMIMGSITGARLGRARSAATRQRDVMRHVIETGLAPVLVFSRERELVFANGPAERTFGLTRPTGAAPSYAIPAVRTFNAAGQQLEGSDLCIVRVFETGQPQRNVRRQVTMPDGTSRTFIVNAAPLVDEHGALLAVVATLTDITEQLDAASALQESNTRLQRMSEVMPGTFFRFRADDDGSYGFDSLSGNFENVIGIHTADAIADFGAVWRALHRDDQPRLDASIRKAVRDRTPWADEFRILAPDDTIHWYRGVARPEPVAAGHSLIWNGVFYDVTQEKHLEQSLLQAQKMESIGRLAGGIAHDFNNVLTAIRGHIDLVIETTPEGNPNHEEFGEIRLAADRAAALTRQLLAFSRKQQLQLREFSVHALLCGLEKMLRRVIGEDIELTVRADASTGMVRADPGQIEQVVMNLVVNARDAMPRGGSLVLKTADVVISDDDATTLHVAPGPYVQLAVEDSGHGMDATTRERLFEPFFTTKPVGQGTGLGLATAYGIVHQCGGAIQVDSAPGEGSTFRVLLPRYECTLAPSAARSTPVAVKTIARLRVLLVEDEPMVRSLARRLLERAGCQVMEVPNGSGAIQWVDAHGTDFDVLLTDVVMPGMNGSELARALAERHPDMRVVFMSGYIDFDASQLQIPNTSVTLLAKPFTRDELVSAVLVRAPELLAASA